MTDWYFEIVMANLNTALKPFLEKRMTLKQRDAFNKKMHHSMVNYYNPVLTKEETK
jgi:hypothetical protein